MASNIGWRRTSSIEYNILSIYKIANIKFWFLLHYYDKILEKTFIRKDHIWRLKSTMPADFLISF